MQRIIDMESSAIAGIKITEAFEEALQLLLESPGKVVTTGIGKAGYIALLFAATMSSTVTPALFVDPADAGHCDLGFFQS